MHFFYNHLYLKVIATAFTSILLFNTGVRAQVVPSDEDFSSYSSSNPLFSRVISLAPIGAPAPLTFQYVRPVGITPTNYMFLGDLGNPAGFRNGLAFYFNAGPGGSIPGSGSGLAGEYRITFAPASDLSAPTGNFGLQSMYLCIGQGNISQVVMQGYRGGLMVANAVMTLGDGSSSISATDLSYTGSDAFSGTTISFGSNWQFLDEIRIHVPGEYPVMVDDLNFNIPTNVAPTAAVTTSVASVTGVTAKINWSNILNSGDNVAVFIKEATTGTASPVDLTTYTADPVFGNGSQIGSSGWYCVHKGLVPSVDVTSLNPGTNYRVMVVGYNGAPGWETYRTGATTNIANLTTIAVPSVQASNISVTPNYTDHRRAFISWVSGNGNRRAVFVRNETVTTGPAIPPVVNNTTYAAFTDSVSVTLGGRVGTSGWYCVYNGASSGPGLPGAVSMNRITVASGQIFNVMVMEYNGTAGSETYNINTATVNPVQYIGANVPATITLPAENILPTSADIKASVNPRMGNITGIVFTYADNPTLTPALGTISTVTPAATSILGSASATTVHTNIAGLTPSTQYYYRASATNNAGTNNGAILSFVTAPVISSVSADIADGHYKTGTVIPVTVTFTSNVVITGTLVLSLNSGGMASYVSGAGTDVLTFNYTVGASEDVADLDVLSLSGGTIRNIFGADASLVLPAAASLGIQKDIVIDTDVPSLSAIAIASNNANTTLAKPGDVITLNFISDEVIVSPVVSIAGNTVVANNTGGNNWSATYTMVGSDADGVLTFSIAYSDEAANAGVPVTTASNSSSVILDKTIPVLNQVTISSDYTNTSIAKTGNVITLSFTSSELISTPMVTIAGHTVTAANTGGNNWSAAYTMITGDADGLLTFNISFSDEAGNAGVPVTTTSNSSSVTFDKTLPVLNPVTIYSDNTNTSKAKTGNVITLNFTSSELIATPLVTIAGHTVTAVNTTGNNWSVAYTMVTGDAEGILAFSITFSDEAGNAGVLVTATSNSSSVTFDRTIPVLNPVTIAANNSRAKIGDVVTLNFTSNEAIAIPVVTIAGHTVTAANTGGNNWSATYTTAAGDAEGVLAFSIAFNDEAGNVGVPVTATSNSSSVAFDKTIPVLNQVTISANNSWAKTGDVVTLNFTSNEMIVTPVVSIARHTVAATNTNANNWSATYIMVGSDAEGNVAFNIAFQDVAGNAGVAVTSAATSVTFDRTAPSVLSINRLSPLAPIAGAGSVVYRVTFSETVKGINTAAFALTKTGTANGTIAVVSVNEGIVTDVTVNNVVTSGTLRLDMTGTGIFDQAGNAIIAYSAGELYTVNTPPAFTVSGPQAITLCSNTSVAIQDLLQTRDVDNGQTLIWTVINNAAHGTISGLSFTANTNGANVTPTSITYTPAANYTGTDAFTVQVSDGDASATLTFQVTVNAVTPSVVLAVTPGGRMPLGMQATFTATATNGGTTPVYTFKVNGQNVQTGNLNTFSSITLRNEDVVTCDLTGNATCTSVPVVASNAITMEVAQSAPLYLFPNPASTTVHVSSTEPMIKVIISNGQGKTVLFRKLANVLLEDINVSGLPTGIYYMVIVDSSGRKQEGKLVVVK